MIRSTVLLMSLYVRSGFALVRSSAITVPSPSTEIELIFLMPSRLLISSSMARTTPSSTSWGDAPG